MNSQRNAAVAVFVFWRIFELPIHLKHNAGHMGPPNLVQIHTITICNMFETLNSHETLHNENYEENPKMTIMVPKGKFSQLCSPNQTSTHNMFFRPYVTCGGHSLARKN
jgi:hypothetical protein